MTRARLPVMALLGMGGLLCAGPLMATLLVGRTGMAPSLRWLGLCLLTWVALGALGWATAQGSVKRTARTLAPTAALAVFLPWAYASDPAFHAVSGARWQALGALALLTALGLAWRGEPAAEGNEPHSFGGPAALVAVLVGMGLMYGLNDVLFEPLGAPPGGPLAPVRFLVPIVPAVIVAALDWARLVGADDVAALGAVAGIAGFLAVWLGVAPAGPTLFAVAATGLVAVARLGSRLGPVTRVAVIAGVALASTDMARYGLGAREVIAAAPEVARLLPALGLLAIAAALAVARQTSRSAAMGGTREA